MRFSRERYFMKQIIMGLIAVLWLFPNPACAQQYNFRNYSVAEGLAQSQVYAICQDRRGNLWLGTRGGGVNIFDGIEDHTGAIWIATDEGVSVTKDGRHFTNYTTKEGLGSNLVLCLMEDKQGIIWMGTNQGGVSKFINGNFVTYTKKTGLPSNIVNCLMQDKDGDTWIGTDGGILRMGQEGSTKKYNMNNGLPSNDIRHIIQDPGGNMWIATYTGGVSVYDGSQFRTFGANDGLTSEKAIWLMNDKKGNIWVATYDEGAYRYDGFHFTHFTEEKGLCNNSLRCMLQDNQGNIWFGSSAGGICRFDSERFKHLAGNNDKLGNVVYAIHEDHLHRMWYASSLGGVTRFDSMKYVLIRKDQGFTNFKVRCIYEDPAGKLWFGTIGDGVFVYDGHGYTHLGSKNGLSSNFINDITSDKYGNIWFATAGGGACFAKESVVDSNKRIAFHKFGPKNGLVSDRVLSLMADTMGNMWMGTQGGGLVKFSNTGDTFFSITTYNVRPGGTHIVRTVTTGNQGRVWIGTGGDGVAWFDGTSFHAFTKADGLSSNNIYSMTFDRAGFLWVGTEKGLDKIELNAGTGIKSVRHYARAEGFNGIETIQNSVCVDHTGNLWFGTVNGTTEYNATEDQPNAQSPAIHITGIKLFFDRIEDTPYKDSLSPWYSIPKSLVLPYDKNELSFDFTGINLSNPEHVSYQWKLEGLDKGWSPPNQNRTATYNNLPPGKYTFMVKSANEDGKWDAEPASFSFTITPPFWATLWFRLSAGAFLVLLVYLGFSLRVRALRRKNQAEKDKIELEKNIIELEQQALLLQMNPHFIFNSLNSISTFITRNEPAAAKKYLAKFARLMRQILQNSTEAFIPLEEEINMLRNYLDLEMLCHGHKFDYQVLADAGLDAAMIAIPPMLIQPFIENAVLHGVVPSENEGHIEISFSQNGKPHEIICKIRDNGIGINHALAAKNQNASDHKSMAYTVTEKRLEMMQENTTHKPQVVVRDLGDISPDRHGTEVVLTIPIEI